jgi:hypothetical protein
MKGQVLGTSRPHQDSHPTRPRPGNSLHNAKAAQSNQGGMKMTWKSRMFAILTAVSAFAVLAWAAGAGYYD